MHTRVWSLSSQRTYFSLGLILYLIRTSAPEGHKLHIKKKYINQASKDKQGMTTKTPTRFEYRTPTRRPPSGGRHHTSTHRVSSALRNTPTGDRFVPSRASTDLQFARFKMSNVLRDENSPPDKQMLDKLLELRGVNSASKTLHFNSPVSSKQCHCEYGYDCTYVSM